MSKQTIRYAVGQIAFLMKGPRGEALGIPKKYFGKPCVIVERGVIRMLSDGSEWCQSSMLHRMLAFPRVGDSVMCSGVCCTVAGIDHDDMDVDNVPQPLCLSGGHQKWPIFDGVSLISEEHDPDIALLPEAPGFTHAVHEVAAALEDWYYTKTAVKYIPTSEDLPGTLGCLNDDFRQHSWRALRVWSGGTDTSIYARIGKPDVNLIFRLYNDLLHIEHDAGMDLYGELIVAWRGLDEFPKMSQEARLVYMIDTAGQTLLHYLTGKPLEDQYAFVSWIWHFMTLKGGTNGEYSLQDLQDAVRRYHNMTSKPMHVIGGC